jgi:hypothetical protein
MFPKYEEINWNNWYKLERFVVFDVPHKWIPFNLFDEIWDYLEDWLNIPKFDENRNIIDSVYSDYILVEYSDKNVRDRDIRNNSKINIINSLKSEKIDWDKQLAENTWNFEYNWKYYLVLNPYNPFTEETNPDLWIYKWIIIDSDKYFWINEKVEWEIKKVEWDIDSIL